MRADDGASTPRKVEMVRHQAAIRIHGIDSAGARELRKWLVQFRIKRRCELAEAVANLCTRPGGKSESESSLGLRLHKAGRQWRGPETHLIANGSDQRQICFSSQPGNEMQTSFRNLQSKILTQEMVELVDEVFSSIAI